MKVFIYYLSAQRAVRRARAEKREDDEKQRARGVETRNRRKAQQTEGAGNTRRHGVRGGERKKCSQRNVPRKPSKVTLFREIVDERIRHTEGRQKSAKKAFTNWHLSFHVLPQKWALAILGPREKTTPKKLRDNF